MVGGVGLEIDYHCNSIDGYSWISGPSGTAIQSNRVYNYFVTGKDE
jgi:hypothetical protein